MHRINYLFALENKLGAVDKVIVLKLSAHSENLLLQILG
jgi:hypothetical protein